LAFEAIPDSLQTESFQLGFVHEEGAEGMLSMVCFFGSRKTGGAIAMSINRGTRWPRASEEPLVLPDSDVAL
jgi:hypothetical protein